MIEISHLRCFIAVAEELHFGQAAIRLNMTQPPLSRQIQLLERNMDCRLFYRTSRSVTLTEAGRAFLPEAQRILRSLEIAQTTVRDISLGQTGMARCGFTAATAYRFLPNLIRTMGERIPEGSLELKEMVSSKQIAALDMGELEVCLLRPSMETRKYMGRLVAREKLVLAIPTGHPLCDRETARWRDLHDIDLIMYDSVEAKYFHDILSHYFTLRRVWPNIVQQLTQIHSILSLVRARVGAAIVPDSARILEISNVEYREFSDESSPYAELLILWKEENRNPLVPAVVEIAESLL
jgi:DNA-binding transcriptional LysR family regulator